MRGEEALPRLASLRRIKSHARCLVRMRADLAGSPARSSAARPPVLRERHDPAGSRPRDAAENRESRRGIREEGRPDESRQCPALLNGTWRIRHGLPFRPNRTRNIKGVLRGPGSLGSRRTFRLADTVVIDRSPPQIPCDSEITRSFRALPPLLRLRHPSRPEHSMTCVEIPQTIRTGIFLLDHRIEAAGAEGQARLGGSDAQDAVDRNSRCADRLRESAWAAAVPTPRPAPRYHVDQDVLLRGIR